METLIKRIFEVTGVTYEEMCSSVKNPSFNYARILFCHEMRFKHGLKGFAIMNYAILKPSEIRIGNLVAVNNQHWPDLKDKPLEVIGINQCKPIEGYANTGYSVQLIDRNNYNKTYSQFICFIEPLPINTLVLTRMGFFQEKGWMKFKIDNNSYEGYVSVSNKTKHCRKMGPFCWQLSLPKTKYILLYVHQLQNICFFNTSPSTELVLQDF